MKMNNSHFVRQKSFKIPLFVSSLVLSIGLAGCSSTVPEVEGTLAPLPSSSSSPTPGPTSTPAATAASLKDFDLENADWTFFNGYEIDDIITVSLANGEATRNGSQFKMGEVVYSDVNDDGVQDAVASLDRYEGNGLDSQWYVWLADVDKPEQLQTPIAQSRNCGDFVKNVRAVNGGVKISEVRRSGEDSARSCAEGGTGDVTRTVAVEKNEVSQAWEPVQTAPTRAYGGVCPAMYAGGYEPGEFELYAMPSEKSKIASKSGEISGAQLPGENGTVLGGEPRGWSLVNVVEADNSMKRCAWVRTS